jgi:NAD(P)-dependent dehydrogenase (short-subunit alcohol dehydrogenase family)
MQIPDHALHDTSQGSPSDTAGNPAEEQVMTTRTALVTGANRGIGFEVCRQLGRQGYRIMVGSRNPEAGELAATELRTEGIDASAVTLDVSQPASIARAMAHLQEHAIHVDVLVNNAGIYPSGDLKDMDMAVIRECMEVGFFGPLALCRALLPGMQRAGYGRIVNLSSGLGQLSEGLDGGPGAYAVSKTAMNALSNRLATEVSGDIKVNSVCPGWVKTRMGGAGAHREVGEGAAGVVWAATLPADGPTGGFFRDGKPIPW